MSSQQTIPLILGVKATNWRAEGEYNNDAAFEAVKTEVLRRDGYRCRAEGCGLSLPKYLEVHHLDGDHSNNTESNLITLCNWCHGAFHIGQVGLKHLAMLGMHPEWPHKTLPSQGVMNHWMRAAYIAPSTHQKEAEASVDFFTMCVDAFEVHARASDPVIVANILMAMNDNEYADRAKMLDGVRLIYLPSKPVTDNPQVNKAWDWELKRREYWRAEFMKTLGDWRRYQ